MRRILLVGLTVLSLLLAVYNFIVGLRLTDGSLDTSILVGFPSINKDKSAKCSARRRTLLDLYPDALSCADVYQRVQSTHANDSAWWDPNQGRVFARQTVTEPRVWISVHNQSYDPLRWDTLYERGRYYEHAVLNRFNVILGQVNQTHTAMSENDKDCLIIDVGANIGYYTMVAAAHGCSVLSFELLPFNILRYCQSVGLNAFEKQVALYQNGVSNVVADFQVYIDKENPGKSRLKLLGAIRRPWDVTVQTVTLDLFAQDHGWFDESGDHKKKQTKIKLLKIDVEGGEYSVVKGAKEFLKAGLAEHVLLEMRFPDYYSRFGTDDPAAQMVAILFEGGYMVRDAGGCQNARTGNSTRDAEDFLTKLRRVTRRPLQRDMWFFQPNE